MAVDNSKRNVRSLMSRIRAYERFFKEREITPGKAKPDETGRPEPSNQAHTAYMNLIKLVHALEKDSPKTDTGAAWKLSQEKVREVLRDVYGI